jgi:methyl-accepting chemotaxis protein
MTEKSKIHFGIFPKILIAMVLTAVIPSSAIWFVNYQSTSTRLAGQIEQQLDGTAEGLQGYVDTWFEMNLRMLRQNAGLPGIQSMDPEQQNPVLKLISEEYNWNYLAFTVAPDGNNIGRSDGKAPKFYGDRVYVQEVLKGADLGQQVLIGKTSGKPALVLSVPIRSEGGSVVGVLAIAMTIAELSDRVTHVRVGETGQAFLVDQHGKVIAHQNVAYSQDRKDLSDHPAVIAGSKRRSVHLSYVGADGEKMVATARRSRQGWILVAEQTQREAFAPVKQANRNALVLLVMTLSVVGVAAFLLSRRLSVPIQRLTVIADDISRGRLDERIEYVNRGDEIGALARAIDRLRASVRLALKRLVRDKSTS